jgi:phage-related baseplate assembly protein
MSSPFHVDGEFSPYRALFVAALLVVVLAQIAAMFMVTRGQVLQVAQRDAQSQVAAVTPGGESRQKASLAPARMLVAGGDMPDR